MQIKTTGSFRMARRTLDPENYEVYYKHYIAGLMILVAHGLTKELAQELKENLNNQLFGEKQDDTPDDV